MISTTSAQPSYPFRRQWRKTSSALAGACRACGEERLSLGDLDHPDASGYDQRQADFLTVKEFFGLTSCLSLWTRTTRCLKLRTNVVSPHSAASGLTANAQASKFETYIRRTTMRGGTYQETPEGRTSESINSCPCTHRLTNMVSPRRFVPSCG